MHTTKAARGADLTNQRRQQPPYVGRQNPRADCTVTGSWPVPRGCTVPSRLSTEPFPGPTSAAAPTQQWQHTHSARLQRQRVSLSAPTQHTHSARLQRQSVSISAPTQQTCSARLQRQSVSLSAPTQHTHSARLRRQSVSLSAPTQHTCSTRLRRQSVSLSAPTQHTCSARLQRQSVSISSFSTHTAHRTLDSRDRVSILQPWFSHNIRTTSGAVTVIFVQLRNILLRTLAEM